MSRLGIYGRAVVLFIILSIILGVVGGVGAVYYAFPSDADIKVVLVKADPEDKAPPQDFVRLVEMANLKGVSTTALVARELLNIYAPNPKRGALKWQVDYFLWDFFVRLKVPHEELPGLYCSLAFNGEGKGVNALSVRVFSKPLSELSQEEMATLALMLRSPRLVLQGRSVSTDERDSLLSEFRQSKVGS